MAYVPNPTVGANPGIGAKVETTEKKVWYGRYEQLLIAGNVQIGSSTVDAGNSPTTELRPGLILGMKTSDSKLYQWNPDATDGTERVFGVLLEGLSMLDNYGTVEDKTAQVIIKGGLDAASLLIEGTLFTSSTAEHLARCQMADRFLFSDDIQNGAGFLGQPIRNLNVITDQVVTAAHNGTRFIATTADCDFTLPTIEAGLAFEFLRASDHEMAVISAEGDNIIVGNDLSADSVTFTTAGQQIGALVRIEAVYVGSTLKWLATLPSVPFGTGLTGGFAYAIAT